MYILLVKSHDIYNLKIFSITLWIVFSLSLCVSSEAHKVFILITSSLPIFHFGAYTFVVPPKKPLPTPRLWKSIPTFSSKSLIVNSKCTFKSIVHFELFFFVWCEILLYSFPSEWYSFHLLYLDFTEILEFKSLCFSANLGSFQPLYNLFLVLHSFSYIL